ncbi:flippase activity-associated protein Agl23 [Halospeciosus flavus]|uniref:flippase activity-associated protein Agl23 n=1 Tax=Halospeciosus flavus TaxID=3032283 RepID=UPI003607718E
MSGPRRLTRPLPALLLVSVGALLVRLFRLGERVAHQDEGRVGDWILHYVATGQWDYRPIIHGPFLPHVNGTVFSVLGPSDFTARLVVAVVGALLPLAALLFRDHLRDTEVVAMGLFLAANPILIYYSRFMRNDLPLAAFVLVTVGFALRAIDRPERRPHYLALATFFFALAFTTKENALLYPVAWAGSLALVADRRLLARESPLPRRLVGALARADARTVGRGGLLAVALFVEFFVVFVAFYAPKPDLYHALADPTKLPGVLSAATVGVWHEFANTWLVSGMHDHSVVAFLGKFLEILAVGGAPSSSSPRSASSSTATATTPAPSSASSATGDSRASSATPSARTSWPGGRPSTSSSRSHSPRASASPTSTAVAGRPTSPATGSVRAPRPSSSSSSRPRRAASRSGRTSRPSSPRTTPSSSTPSPRAR